MRYRKSEAKAYGRVNLHGIWAAIRYPFTTAGELDEADLRKNVRKYVDAHFDQRFWTSVTINTATYDYVCHGTLTLVASLKGSADTAIDYLAGRNQNPNPKRYVWKAKGEIILRMIQKARQATLQQAA